MVVRRCLDSSSRRPGWNQTNCCRSHGWIDPEGNKIHGTGSHPSQTRWTYTTCEWRYLGFCELHWLVPPSRWQRSPRPNGLLTAAALSIQGYVGILAIVPAPDAAPLFCCSNGTPLGQLAFVNAIQKLFVAAKNFEPRPLLRPLVLHRDFHLSSARTAGTRHGPVGEQLHPPLHQDITRHTSPSGKVSRLTAANERYLEPLTKLT